MEETEDEIDSNLVLSSTKKFKFKSSKYNFNFKKNKQQSKEKYKMDTIHKIFNQGIASNQPLKMVFTSNNTIKPLPILSNGVKNNNDDYLIINEEMKINKNVFENNLYNLIQKERTKKKMTNRNYFSSFLKESSINELKKDDKEEKEQNSEEIEDQKSIESYSGKLKGATSPSSNSDLKRKNITLIIKNNKKYKLKNSVKQHKKQISIIKMLNKPICFISSKCKKDNNQNDEVRKLNINKNILSKFENKEEKQLCLK